MKKINSIEDNLKKLQKKLDQNGRDWTSEEKRLIAESYSEITKQSTGFARSVDIGCPECVQSAVNIIKNYRKLVAQAETKAPLTIVEDDWRATNATVAAKAKELGCTLPKSATSKALKIEVVAAFIAANRLECVEPLTDEDLLGHEYTFEHLAEVIKAKTGEIVTEDDITYEELLERVNELTEDEDGEEAITTQEGA